jgi:Family of unknown function (DUF6263)
MPAISRCLVAIAVLGVVPALGGGPHTRESQAPGPEVEVLDAGAEPREALRFAPAVGASEQAAMTMRLELEQSGVSDASVKAPPVRTAIAATLQEVTPDGVLNVAFSYPSFEVLKGGGASAEQRRAVERALSGLNGLAGGLTLTTRGALVDSNVDIPPGVDRTVSQFLEQLRNQFRDLTVPLPEPAVGVGARWRVTTQLTLNGIQARQVYEYRLEKRTGTTLELDVRGTQTARRQTVDAQGGVELRVKRYKTTFRGAITTDLTRLLPSTSRVRGSGDQTFDVRRGDDRGELRQHIEVETSLKPA